MMGHNGYGVRQRPINRRGMIAVALLATFFGGVFSPPASAADGPIRTIMAFGDSLTSGYGLPPADAFPVKLEAALRARGHAVRVINAGVAGDTTAGGRARLAWMLADKPDAVILELGANDGLRGLDPAETLANLRAIMEQLKAADLPVLLAGMRAPPNLGRDFGAEFDTIFATVALEYDALFYPFFLEGVAARPTLNQNDGIHPNSAGVAIVVERIIPSVEALLSRVQP
ncbi:MAG: arylesterase [Alphaproteobacteria bacterium]|nr:arylesterase [Alphaproteobacteria bacterium]MEC8026946.1 arylesterase [Pseudomonadota bacterium]MEC8281850.1 arylesterase [Pseudomonadota bacterium]MED5365306.1 arylesterase [Pseudomonadota bacterium]